MCVCVCVCVSAYPTSTHDLAHARAPPHHNQHRNNDRTWLLLPQTQRLRLRVMQRRLI